MQALLSVSDKTGLIELAQKLHNLNIDLIASGGTARAIREAGLPVRDVSDLTSVPEILGGRVKTLHPAIHGGILARDLASDQADLQSLDYANIDLVVCNLYPFQRTASKPDIRLNDVLNQIDVGGPALLKAAAKNFERVVVVCETNKYEDLLWHLASKGEVPYETRFEWAKAAFEHVTAYDSMVYATLLEFDLATGQRISKSCRF